MGGLDDCVRVSVWVGRGGGDVQERRGEYSFCSHLGTAGLCSQRHLKSLQLLFCLLLRLAELTKNPLICGRLFEDNKMSEGNSNNKKMRTKEQVYFKHIFSFLGETFLSTRNIYWCPTHMVLRFFSSKILSAVQCQYLFYITISKVPVNYFAHQCASASGSANFALKILREEDERVVNM